MSTGTVKWFDEDRGYGVITPDDGSEDLVAYSSALQMSGLNTLREGERVSFVTVYGPTGKQASQIWPALAPHLMLDVEERAFDGPEPIERILYLNSEPLAVAYLDKPETEVTLAWPLMPDVRLEHVLDYYLTDFLPLYRPRPSENTLEFWMGDRYYQTVIGSEPTSSLVMKNLTDARSHERDLPGLLQISSESAVMETLFDKPTGYPVRLALLISAVPVQALAKLFSIFHRNEVVRENLAVAMYALAPDPQTYRGPRSLLYPLPIVPEE